MDGGLAEPTGAANRSTTAAMSPLVALIMPRLAVTLIWRPLQPRQQKAQPRE